MSLVVQLDGGAAAVVETLRSAEATARRQHVGMWRYGDPGSDEEDDYPTLGGGPPKRGGR